MIGDVRSGTRLVGDHGAVDVEVPIRLKVAFICTLHACFLQRAGLAAPCAHNDLPWSGARAANLAIYAHVPTFAKFHVLQSIQTSATL